MLVYANEIEIVGNNPALQVLRGIAGWLTEKLDERVVIKDVTTPGERTGGKPKAWLRTDRASTDNFRLYSWVLKHSDPNVTGRQWVTELGLRDEDGEQLKGSEPFNPRRSRCTLQSSSARPLRDAPQATLLPAQCPSARGPAGAKPRGGLL